MTRTFLFASLLLLLVASVVAAADAVVIKDEGVSISREEFTELVKSWTPQMRQAAADDVGDRLELLNIMLTRKKMAARADQIIDDSDRDAYWLYQAQVQTAKQRFLMKNFLAEMVYPDMTELAQERYVTEKVKYARVLERRLSSHILFKCLPGQCDRDLLRPRAQAVLDELRAGADFEALVAKHSGDTGSKKKGGLFDKWMKLGEAGVEPTYTGGVFSIDEIGGYSELVDSRFGLHIIRLEDIDKAHFLPYEDVQRKIVADLQTEYRTLALKEFEGQFRLTDDAFVDGDAMEALFEDYKTR